MHPRKVSQFQSNCLTSHRFQAIILKKNKSLARIDVFEQFKNAESIVWCALALEHGSGSLAPRGAELWPFKETKTGVFGFSPGGTYLEYLSWHVNNTISSLTTIHSTTIDCPPWTPPPPSFIYILLYCDNFNVCANLILVSVSKFRTYFLRSYFYVYFQQKLFPIVNFTSI